MAVYSYGRLIKITHGDDAEVDYSDQVTQCSFSIRRNGGCDGATLVLAAIPFDDFAGLQVGDKVIISFEDGVPWWYGHVTNLRTSLRAGLAVECRGVADTLLAETDPAGTFGTAALISVPSNIEITQEARGNLGEKWHVYWVTAVDEYGVVTPVDSDGNVDWNLTDDDGNYIVRREKGVNLSSTANICTDRVGILSYTSRRVYLSWEATEGAVTYRIYKGLYHGMLAANGGAIGDGATQEEYDAGIGSIEKYSYTDVTGLSFCDDGTVDWESFGEAIATADQTPRGRQVNPGGSVAALPTAHTARAATIDGDSLDSNGVSYGSGYDVNSIVRYLVDTYANAYYDAAQITASISNGTDYDIEMLDLDAADASLSEVLQTLADIAGSVDWGIGADGKLYFRAKVDPFGDDIEGDILKTFYIGKQYDPVEVSDPEAAGITDVLTDASRCATRDGTTQLTVEGNAALGQNILAGRLRDREYGRNSEIYRFDLPDAHSKNAVRSFTTCLVAGDAAIPNDVEDDDGESFFDGYSSVAGFEADYPGLGWLYRAYSVIGGVKIAKLLATIRDRLRQTSEHPERGPRRRGALIFCPGIRTQHEATCGAINIMMEDVPVSGKWDVTVTKAAVQYTPGKYLVAIVNMEGKRYVMEIQTISVDFGNTVTVRLSCGESDAYTRGQGNSLKVLRSVTNRQEMDMLLPGPGNVALGAYDIFPWESEGTLASPSLGGSRVPASATHKHEHDAESINTNMLKDGTAYENIERVFVGSGLDAINDQVNTVRGLQFRTGDMANVGGTPYLRNSANDGWDEIGAGAVPFGGNVQAVGAANDAGSGTDTVHDNHVHAQNYGASADVVGFALTGSIGDSGGVPHANHVHPHRVKVISDRVYAYYAGVWRCISHYS